MSLQVGLFGHFCGGSIISADIVISAAHCCHYVKAKAILAGLNNLDQPEAGAQNVEVDEIVIHPNFTAKLINDICNYYSSAQVLGNRKRVPNGHNLLPRSDYAASRKANVTGWGNIQKGGPSSPALMVVQVPIITDYQWLVFACCAYLSITSWKVQHVKIP